MHKKAHPTHAKQQRPSIYFQKPSRNVCQLLAEYWPIAGENGVPIGVTILRADSGLSGNVKGTVIYSLETHCTPRCQTRNAYVSLNAATKENERRWAQRKPKHTFITCVPASQFLSRKKRLHKLHQSRASDAANFSAGKCNGLAIRIFSR